MSANGINTYSSSDTCFPSPWQIEIMEEVITRLGLDKQEDDDHPDENLDNKIAHNIMQQSVDPGQIPFADIEEKVKNAYKCFLCKIKSMKNWDKWQDLSKNYDQIPLIVMVDLLYKKNCPKTFVWTMKDFLVMSWSYTIKNDSNLKAIHQFFKDKIGFDIEYRGLKRKKCTSEGKSFYESCKTYPLIFKAYLLKYQIIAEVYKDKDMSEIVEEYQSKSQTYKRQAQVDENLLIRSVSTKNKPTIDFNQCTFDFQLSDDSDS